MMMIMALQVENFDPKSTLSEGLILIRLRP